MITIKDYANNHNVSYEAVRKQLRRYADQLEGHITRKNRTQYLDEYAEQFLTEKRQQSVVIVYEQAKEDELEALRKEVSDLRWQLLKAKDTILKNQEKIIELQDERVELLQEKAKQVKLIEASKDREAALEQENQKFKPWHFGLFKKDEE